MRGARRAGEGRGFGQRGGWRVAVGLADAHEVRERKMPHRRLLEEDGRSSENGEIDFWQDEGGTWEGERLDTW